MARPYIACVRRARMHWCPNELVSLSSGIRTPLSSSGKDFQRIRPGPSWPWSRSTHDGLQSVPQRPGRRATLYVSPELQWQWSMMVSSDTVSSDTRRDPAFKEDFDTGEGGRTSRCLSATRHCNVATIDCTATVYRRRVRLASVRVERTAVTRVSEFEHFFF